MLRISWVEESFENITAKAVVMLPFSRFLRQCIAILWISLVILDAL